MRACLPGRDGARLSRALEGQIDSSAQRWAQLAALDTPAVEAAARELHLTLPLRGATQPAIDLPDLLPDEQGIVLTTLHMGDYLVALLRLLLHCADRPLVIVRRRPPERIEEQAFAHLRACGIDFAVLRTAGRHSAHRLIRTLRGGGVAIVLFDLPPTYGDADPVHFFGRSCHWVRGPVACAATARAALLPFFAYRDGETERCDVLEPLLPPRRGATQPVVQQLVHHAERYIARYPDQWLHWERFEAMLRDDARFAG